MECVSTVMNRAEFEGSTVNPKDEGRPSHMSGTRTKDERSFTCFCVRESPVLRGMNERLSEADVLRIYGKKGGDPAHLRDRLQAPLIGRIQKG
jgi:hypothetical protein